MIRAPASPSFAVCRGCDPGELGPGGGVAVHHVVALAQTKTKKSSTSPAASRVSNAPAAAAPRIFSFATAIDRQSIKTKHARNSVPFRGRSVRVTSTSPRTARRSGLRRRRWRRRGDGEGARERAGGRASTYTAIVDGRTRTTDALSRNPVSGEARTGGEKRRRTERRGSC